MSAGSRASRPHAGKMPAIQSFVGWIKAAGRIHRAHGGYDATRFYPLYKNLMGLIGK